MMNSVLLQKGGLEKRRKHGYACGGAVAGKARLRRRGATQAAGNSYSFLSDVLMKRELLYPKEREWKQLQPAGEEKNIWDAYCRLVDPLEKKFKG